MSEIKVIGMSCGHCVESVTKALEELGLSNVRVSLEDAKATFDNTADVPYDKIKETIEDIGFDAE